MKKAILITATSYSIAIIIGIVMGSYIKDKRELVKAANAVLKTPNLVCDCEYQTLPPIQKKK